MSYAAREAKFAEQTGARVVSGGDPASGFTVGWTGWGGLWSEVFRSQAFRDLPQTTTTVVSCFVVEALPVAEMKLESNTTKMLAAVERVFGDSASDIAKILRVSRPMIYHYREGMEPSIENKRRLKTLAELASDLNTMVSLPLRALLKTIQPEGKTLLELLSEEELDMSALRRMLQRNVSAADQSLRDRLAATLARGETAEARGDILRERHAGGKPVYVGDPEAPGKLIQILSDGRRVRGRMLNRQFVPDDK